MYIHKISIFYIQKNIQDLHLDLSINPFIFTYLNAYKSLFPQKYLDRLPFPILHDYFM